MHLLCSNEVLELLLASYIDWFLEANNVNCNERVDVHQFIKDWGRHKMLIASKLCTEQSYVYKV